MSDVLAVRRATSTTVHADAYPAVFDRYTITRCGLQIERARIVEVSGGAARVTCGPCRRALRAEGER